LSANTPARHVGMQTSVTRALVRRCGFERHSIRILLECSGAVLRLLGQVLREKTLKLSQHLYPRRAGGQPVIVAIERHQLDILAGR